MTNIPLTLLALAVLAIISNQQAAGSNKVKANFEGDFDSMNHVQPTTEEKRPFAELDEDSEEGAGEGYEQEEADMIEFAEHMADFLPDETFTFRMQPNQLEQFFLWPGADTLLVRGMFHSEVIADEMEGFVNLALFDNDRLVRNYRQQRLGIFNVRHNLKDHHYTFKFQNSDSQLQVYFSYEFTTTQKREGLRAKNESEIERITREFEKVNRLVVQQESEMSRLVKISDRHQQKIDDYLSSVEWTMVLETLMITVGNMASLMMLKRQLYAGYELLV